MELAKPQVDIGLSTNHLDPMLAFWQQKVGLRFDHALPVRRGQTQYRHDALGSVVKINHHVHPLPAAPPSGYRELMISRELQSGPESLIDPDGNRVCIVPKAIKESIRSAFASPSAISLRTGASTPMRSACGRKPDPRAWRFGPERR
jgi:hypothetical protein